MRLPRWTLFIAVIAFIAVESFFVYLAYLDHRISRELVDGRWRAPTVILSAAGGREHEVMRLYGVDWRIIPPVGLDALPRYVPDAFLAAEDVRFHHHLGIDPIGIARAMVANLRGGGIVQGGSTIDQQIIKSRFLSQERTWRRKFVELLLAIILDARLTKNDILAIYLNEVYLGHSGGSPVLGVDEASRLYFGKPATQLRLDEAALLASIVRAPNRDNPQKRPDLVRARRDAILRVMLDRKWIENDAFRAAVDRGVDFEGGSVPSPPFPFYLRAIRSEIVKRFGVRPVIEGGLTVVCEIDPIAQRAAERVAERAPEQLESRFSWLRAQSRQEPLEVAILSVDPRSGGIRTIVGGRDFHLSPFDRTTNMRRQPGSAFKTFAYLAAIASRRVTTASLLLDAPVTVELSDHETWTPQNYDERYRGRVTLREAFEASLNVPTVRMAQQVGLSRVVDTAEKFGFGDDLAAVPALPLGVTDVTLRELTAAYTPFPNLGIRVEPFLLTEVRDGRGKTMFRQKLQQRRVCDADAAYVMHTLLRGVVKRGTASRLKRYGLGYVAGKTGTTNDYRDAWFVGYTADMVTTVWIGYDHGAPLRLSSAEAAIPIWGSYMAAVQHSRDEPQPPSGVTFRDIDPETGMLWDQGCPGPVHEVFLDGTAPTRHCPRGFLGGIVRRVFFQSDHFDEPAAISFEKFREWANEVDRSRQEVEGFVGRLKRLFGK
ncbi:MAG TPA: PBP1A family penicillin-binding protein [Thermoanaerobaculia bacterium]|nr:PBP1A family penicillin-binding protein [Thermoanaerobaculia bacterium]